MDELSLKEYENDESELPILSEDEIEELATSKVMERGHDLFDDGALSELACQGTEISALCEGSDYEPYELRAELTSQGIGKTYCTCPYDYEGICKHLVALLLAWAHTPEDFVSHKAPTPNAEPVLLSSLKKRERDELAHLIIQLVETEPKLKALVQRFMKPQLTQNEAKKVEKSVTGLLKKVLKSGYNTNFMTIGREIRFYERSAASLQTTRPQHAGALYAAILQGMISAGSEAVQWDRNRIITEISAECCTALAALASSGEVSRTHRRDWLGVLTKAFLFDLELGGVGFGDGAEEAIFSADDEEWPRLEKMLDAAVEKSQADRQRREETRMLASPKREYYDLQTRWDYAQVVELKTFRLRSQGQNEKAEQFLLEFGTPQQQIEVLLKNKDFDRAISIADQAYPRYLGLLHTFADELDEAGEWTRARDFAQRHKLLGWLAAAAIRHGEGDALQLNLDLFKIRPTWEQWQAVMNIIVPTEKEPLRSQLWAQLEQRGLMELQCEIALKEGHIAQALELWPKLRQDQKFRRHDDIANAAEHAPPDEAFLLWDALVHSLIAQRSRNAYRLAAKALFRIKHVLESASLEHEWTEHLAGIRKQYERFPALQDELKQAKIL
jgi:hypothetical protein